MNIWYFALYYVEIPSKSKFENRFAISNYIFEL